MMRLGSVILKVGGTIAQRGIMQSVLYTAVPPRPHVRFYCQANEGRRRYWRFSFFFFIGGRCVFMTNGRRRVGLNGRLVVMPR